MRRILLVMSVAALTAAMLAVTAVPAFATIHELAAMENAFENTPGTVENGDEQTPLSVQTESPPGTSEFGSPSFVRSIQAVQTEGELLIPGGSLEGENPSGGESTNAFTASNPGNK